MALIDGDKKTADQEPSAATTGGVKDKGTQGVEVENRSKSDMESDMEPKEAESTDN